MAWNESLYSHDVILDGEKLKISEPIFLNECIVCGKPCGTDNVSIKAWVANYTFFAELSRTRVFKIPAHSTIECGFAFRKRWMFAKYTPVATDALALVVSISMLYFYSFFAFLISGLLLILGSALLQIYLRMSYRLPLKVSQSLTLTRINYKFEFENLEMAGNFRKENLDFLVDEKSGVKS